MVLNYYPGCTLKNQAADLDRCARVSAEALGITLAELPQWQCCGGVYPMATDEIATRLSAVRALAEAGELLVTACPLCKYNLMQNAAGVPTVYFTQLLAEALGLTEEG